MSVLKGWLLGWLIGFLHDLSWSLICLCLLVLQGVHETDILSFVRDPLYGVCHLLFWMRAVCVWGRGGGVGVRLCVED